MNSPVEGIIQEKERWFAKNVKGHLGSALSSLITFVILEIPGFYPNQVSMRLSRSSFASSDVSRSRRKSYRGNNNEMGMDESIKTYMEIFLIENHVTVSSKVSKLNSNNSDLSMS